MRIRTLLIAVLFISSLFSHAQSNWHNYISVYFTGDASMEYIGPSFQIGTDLDIKHNFTLSAYAQYFYKDYGDHGFQTLSVAALCQYNFGKKKMYVASGVAYQRAIEHDDLHRDVINRSIILPAFRIGYVIFINKYALCLEICTTGPYNDSGSTEIFTLPSVGLRVFRQIKPIRTIAK